MTDSVSTLRLLAKCGSMDLSALGPIADEMERQQNMIATREEALRALTRENERLTGYLKSLGWEPTEHDSLRRLTDEPGAAPKLRRFRPVVEGGHIHSMAEVGNPNGFGGWNAEYVLASDYDELMRSELKSNPPPANQAASWMWRCPTCGGDVAAHSQAVQLGRCSLRTNEQAS